MVSKRRAPWLVLIISLSSTYGTQSRTIYGTTICNCFLGPTKFLGRFHCILSHPIPLHCIACLSHFQFIVVLRISVQFAWRGPNRTEPNRRAWFGIGLHLRASPRTNDSMHACMPVRSSVKKPARLPIWHYDITRLAATKSCARLWYRIASHRIVLKRIWHTHICSFLLFGSNPQASKHGKKQPRGSVCRRRRHRSFCFKNGGNQPKRKK